MMRRPGSSTILGTQKARVILGVGVAAIVVILMVGYRSYDDVQPSKQHPGQQLQQPQQAEVFQPLEVPQDGAVVPPDSPEEEFHPGDCQISNELQQQAAAGCGWNRRETGEAAQTLQPLKLSAVADEKSGKALTVEQRWEKCKFREIHPRLQLMWEELGWMQRNWEDKDAKTHTTHVAFEKLTRHQRVSVLCLGYSKDTW